MISATFGTFQLRPPMNLLPRKLNIQKGRLGWCKLRYMYRYVGAGSGERDLPSARTFKAAIPVEARHESDRLPVASQYHSRRPRETGAGQ
jgi:hypothetical protein